MMIQINLLPWREQVRKQHQIEFGIVVGLFVLIGLLLVGLIHFYNSRSISNQMERNKMLEVALAKENENLSKLTKMNRKVDAINEQLQFIFSLRDSSYRAVRILTQLAKVNPDTITLMRVTRNGNTITVLGQVRSNLQISMLMDRIEKSEYFKQPDLTRISGEAGQPQRFQLRVQLRE